MKKLLKLSCLALLILCLSLLIACDEDDNPTPSPDPTWKIVFEDNFDGDSLDTANWSQYESTPPPYSLTGSGELQIDGESSGGDATFVYNTAISGNYVRVNSKFRTTQNDPINDDVDLAIHINVDFNSDSRYSLVLTSDPSGASRDYELAIVKRINSVDTVLLHESMGGTMPQISAGNNYILEGINSNGNITFAVKDDGGTILKSLSLNDSSPFSDGKIAISGDLNIGTTGQQSIFFDYVIVEKYY